MVSADAMPVPRTIDETLTWDRRQIERRLLQLETRRRIYEHIQGNPGVHLRQIVRELGFALGTVEHHLHTMVRHGLLESRFSGPRRRSFFARGGRSHHENDLMAVLRSRPVRRLVECVLHDPDVDAGQLSQRLQLAPATVGYHLQRLVKWNVLEELRLGRSRLYRLKHPRETVAVLDQLRHAERLDAALQPPDQADNVMQYLLLRIPEEPQRGRAEPGFRDERTIRA